MIKNWLLSDKMAARFFQPRVDDQGNVVPKRLRTKLYQRWFEAGHSLPWIYSTQQCHQYWQVQDGLDASVMNRPEEYALSPVNIMAHLERFFSAWVTKNDSICELGCNAGAKLNWLREHGYHNLSGVELNASCKPVMEKLFPDLAHNLQLHMGSFETVLPTLSHKYDFVYTLSAIQHTHPLQNAVFAAMANMTRKYFMTVEIEWAGGQYFFPRNYRRIFQQHGLQQIFSILLTRYNCQEPELAAYWGHVIRFFQKDGS